MEISTEKSSFLRVGIIEDVFNHIILLFPYKVELWDKGLITLVIGQKQTNTQLRTGGG